MNVIRNNLKLGNKTLGKSVRPHDRKAIGPLYAITPLCHIAVIGCGIACEYIAGSWDAESRKSERGNEQLGPEMILKKEGQ